MVYQTVPMYEMVQGNEVVQVMDVIELDTLLFWNMGYENVDTIIEKIDRGIPFQRGTLTIRRAQNQAS